MMPTLYERIFSWLALPVYVWQGLGVRKRSMRLPPPPQKPIVDLKGKGKPVRILFIGDSSAAGVGVENFDESVAGRLPYLLSQALKRPIHQRTCGNNSATSGQIRDFVLPNLGPAEYDFVVLSIGVNDAKNFHSSRRFKKEFGTLIYAIRARYPGAEIIWQGLLDMEGIPILPSPLNRILGIRSRVLRNVGNTLCFERGAHDPESRWRPLTENFSHDGFHASSAGYQEWAEELAEYIIKLVRQEEI